MFGNHLTWITAEKLISTAVETCIVASWVKVSNDFHVVQHPQQFLSKWKCHKLLDEEKHLFVQHPFSCRQMLSFSFRRQFFRAPEKIVAIDLHVWKMRLRSVTRMSENQFVTELAFCLLIYLTSWHRLSETLCFLKSCNIMFGINHVDYLGRTETCNRF